MALRLAIFDFDGTLIDSAAAIVSAMRAAFKANGLPEPTRDGCLAIVGLSLNEAIAAMRPPVPPHMIRAVADSYRAQFFERRKSGGSEAESPLFEGAREALERLHASGALIGAATGKSRRGLEATLDHHQIRRFFNVLTQTADDAASKPHPEMILNVMAATGAAPHETVMIGDTRFDMEMARAAGCRALGVSWGHHERADVIAAGADLMIDRFDEMDAALARLWGDAP